MTTISVPYVQGDAGGLLTRELVRQLSTSGHFLCLQEGGTLLLKVALAEQGNERIGFRYDRKGSQAKLQKNLVGIENRKKVVAQVTLIESATGKLLFGPYLVKADADYDYINPDSARDLVFKDTHGKKQKVLNFSLGQLDSVEGAQDDALIDAYHFLSQKIVDGLIYHNWGKRSE